MLACIVGHCAAPVVVAAAQPGPAIGCLCCAMGICTGAQHPAMAAVVDKWCLPSERGWVSALDGLVSAAGCLLNCMVVAQLMVVLDWRATLLLLSCVITVALVGVKFFVTDGPVAGAGLLRLSDGEADLFRAEGMLCDESSLRSTPNTTKPEAAGAGSVARLAATATGWSLIAVEMSVAWR
jgi:sugar phosphate permease